MYLFLELQLLGDLTWYKSPRTTNYLQNLDRVFVIICTSKNIVDILESRFILINFIFCYFMYFLKWWSLLPFWFDDLYDCKLLPHTLSFIYPIYFCLYGFSFLVLLGTKDIQVYKRHWLPFKNLRTPVQWESSSCLWGSVVCLEEAEGADGAQKRGLSLDLNTINASQRNSF